MWVRPQSPACCWYTGAMNRSRFESLVRQALLDIPEEMRAHLDNVDVVLEDHATRDQLVGTGLEESGQLLGLYEGVPLTDRDDYGFVLPDKITLFQNAIEAMCSSEGEILREVRETVVHEVAHHFGISDGRLEEMGL